MRRRESFDVRVPPEWAFDFFTDPRRIFATANGKVVATWDGDLGSGTVMHLDGAYPSDRTEWLVDQYVRPRLFVARMWLARDPRIAGVLSLEFTGTDRGTRVRSEATMSMGFAAELGAVLLRPLAAVVGWRGTRNLIRRSEAEFEASVADRS